MAENGEASNAKKKSFAGDDQEFSSEVLALPNTYIGGEGLSKNGGHEEEGGEISSEPEDDAATDADTSIESSENPGDVVALKIHDIEEDEMEVGTASEQATSIPQPPSLRIGTEVEECRPGAYAVVGPGGVSAEDNTVVIGSEGSADAPVNSSLTTANPDLPLTASLAEATPPPAPKSAVLATVLSDSAGMTQPWIRKKYILFGSATCILQVCAVVAVVVVVLLSSTEPLRNGTGTSTKASTALFWSQKGMRISEPEPFSRFGATLSLSDDGNIFASSFESVNDTFQLSTFIVQVYEYDGIAGTWEQKGESILGLPFVERNPSLKMTPDGRLLVVGYHLFDYSDEAYFGVMRVYLYSPSEKNWLQVGADMLPLYDEIRSDDITSQVSVSIAKDGETVALGTPSTTSSSNNNVSWPVGRVRVFDWIEGNWTQRGMDAELEGRNEDDDFGGAVSFDGTGNILAVGATGRAQVYEWTGSNWEQKGQTLVGSGSSVSLSEDGRTLAVGAPSNDNPNGEFAGHIRVFMFDDSSSLWVQLGHDINGNRTNDRFGGDLQLTADGRGFCAGAAYHNGANGFWSGQVKVYRFNRELADWEQMAQDLEGEGGQDYFGSTCSISADGRRVAGGAASYTKASYVRVFDLIEV